ncbi:hypothetical protein B0H14DRAFT_3447614 [Mycena olivaceomarginata]|nr:hypothetical protein B0H14DRAFT_3447614 [Mycena olivaceomarginata]
MIPGEDEPWKLRRKLDPEQSADIFHGNPFTSVSEAAPMLDMHRVLPTYKHSSKRLLLMDLEGTLSARLRARPGGAPADTDGDAGLERVLEVLRCFVADGRNDVWLLSGLPIAGVLSRIAKEVSLISQ